MANKPSYNRFERYLLNNTFVLVFFVLASFILFGNGISGDFVFDDHFVITGNPLVGDASRLGEIFTHSYHFKQPETGLYRPLTILSYSLNEIFFGESPASFHIVNIILHGLVCYFIFRLLSLFTEKRIAFIAGLVFMFLPIHVEAVTSIIGRAEILATLFIVLALREALGGKQYLSLAYFFLALLSKEIAVAFIPIWIFILFRYKNKEFFSSLKSLIPYIGVLMSYFLLRYIALGSHIFSAETQFVYNPLKHLPFISSVATALKVAFLYISKILLPFSFSSDYSYNQIQIISYPWNSWQSLAGVAGLAALLWLAYKYKSWGLASILFLAPFFVVSNFIFKTGTIMAERLMYMPSLGFAFLGALLVEYFMKKSETARKVALAVLCFLFIFYSYQIIVRNKDWLTEDRLFASAYEAAPESIVNKTNKAYLLMKNGNLEDAKKEIDSVLSVRPEHLGALHLAGRIYQLRGDIDAAYSFWSQALLLKPNYARAIMNMGQIDYERGNYDKAEIILGQAVEFYPRWNEVFLLAMTKTKLKKYDESINLVNRYFGDNPENNNLKFALGLAYYRKGDVQRAKFYFDQSRNPEVSEEDFIKALESL